MMTEYKGEVMAVSFTRVLGVLTFILWVVLVLLFTLSASAQRIEALYVVTSMLGTLVVGKTVKDFGKALKGRSSYAATPATLQAYPPPSRRDS
jgi:hypothetical protein